MKEDEADENDYEYTFDENSMIAKELFEEERDKQLSLNF